MHLFTPGPSGPYSPSSYFGAVLLSFVGGMVVSYMLLRCGARPVNGGSAAGARLASTRVANAITATVAAREEMKMTLVVRKDLKMSTGKIAAQCAHAAVAVVDEVNDVASEWPSNSKLADKAVWVEWLDAWRTFGSKKVALKIDGDEALSALEKKAKAEGLPHYVIHDAGRTQIAAGSRTVLAVGPAPASRVDAVTGHLPVL